MWSLTRGTFPQDAFNRVQGSLVPVAKTFAEQMVIKLEALLLANPGVQSITVDGVATSYVDLETRLERYKSQAARENGTRKRFNSAVPLGSFLP